MSYSHVDRAVDSVDSLARRGGPIPRLLLWDNLTGQGLTAAEADAAIEEAIRIGKLMLVKPDMVEIVWEED